METLITWSSVSSVIWDLLFVGNQDNRFNLFGIEFLSSIVIELEHDMEFLILDSSTNAMTDNQSVLIFKRHSDIPMTQVFEIQDRHGWHLREKEQEEVTEWRAALGYVQAG